jgi:hypothetical protein
VFDVPVASLRISSGGGDAPVPAAPGTPTPKPSEILNPYVTVPTKPWAFAGNHPYKALFYSCLADTPWKGQSNTQVGALGCSTSSEATRCVCEGIDKCELPTVALGITLLF